MRYPELLNPLLPDPNSLLWQGATALVGCGQGAFHSWLLQASGQWAKGGLKKCCLSLLSPPEIAASESPNTLTLARKSLKLLPLCWV